jgi:hypothetical protein
VFTATGDGDQAPSTKQQQVAVGDLRRCEGERDEFFCVEL